jgi:hypothetical protein
MVAIYGIVKQEVKEVSLINEDSKDKTEVLITRSFIKYQRESDS